MNLCSSLFTHSFTQWKFLILIPLSQLTLLPFIHLLQSKPELKMDVFVLALFPSQDESAVNIIKKVNSFHLMSV